jgi:hypothetical protein
LNNNTIKQITFIKFVLIFLFLNTIEIFCIVYPKLTCDSMRIDELSATCFICLLVIGLFLIISFILFLFSIYLFKKKIIHILILIILNIHIAVYLIYSIIHGHF